jgi:2-amino-4-hydroxy-6-hydroxymethyldihydropteridine diphosphokinase
VTSPNPHAIDADTLSGMKPLRKVVFSLGSNLGDRLANLQGAVDAIRDTPDVIVVDVSSVYETGPIGMDDSTPDFLNIVLVGESTLEPRTLLERAQAIEDAFGRERGEINASRTLDVDLVMVGNTKTEQSDLTLPHPRAHERGFVLVPWAEVDPSADLPGRGQIVTLIEQTGSYRVTKRDDLIIEGD